MRAFPRTPGSYPSGFASAYINHVTMSCGCKNRKGPMLSTRAAADETGNSAGESGRTRPSEACFLCADKHLSSAVLEASTRSRAWFVLGELELARRHLLAADPALAGNAAVVICSAAAADKNWRDGVSALSRAVASRLALPGEDKRMGVDADPSAYDGTGEGNPLLGVLHLGAACRLVRELNYIQENRAMIIGDLVAAAEQLARTSIALSQEIRELRHTAQIAVRSDLSDRWIDICDRAARLLPPWHSAAHLALLPGLRAYLGLT